MAKLSNPPAFKKVKVSKKEPWMNQHISFTDVELPEGKDWEVGNEYKLELKVKQVSKQDREGEPFKAEFLVTGVKAK